MASSAARTAKAQQSTTHALTLDEQLRRKLDAARKYRGTIQFFRNHRELLGSGRQRSKAVAASGNARRRLAQLAPAIERLRAAIARRDARRLASMSPRAAICDVFRNDCRAAVAVAWCESRLRPTAQNGQYLGMFQMGSTARRVFGHGPTAHDQAVAAHRYYVRSGRDWSPWSCRWAAS